ncbi:MAG: hypothetical protein JWM09_68 [Francisellaceae bacterium]|nr:hypothetical protein [Francisellaceae bacterium]
MDFYLDNGAATYQIKSCTKNEIYINNTSYQHSLIITPHHLIKNWPVSSINQLKPNYLSFIIEFKPEIFILGTGETLEFPAIELLSDLINHQIGYEIMDTPAACRTYTLLMADKRKVAAALII